MRLRERDLLARRLGRLDDRGDAEARLTEDELDQEPAEQADRLTRLLAEQDAGDGAYFVLVEDDGSVVGRANLVLHQDGVAELGYRVAERATGRGLASAAVRELCGYAGGLPGVRLLRAATTHDNLASQRVLVNAGFAEVGPAEPDEVGGGSGTRWERAVG